MEVENAMRAVHNLRYLPGWTFNAVDHTKRFESAIKVRIDYPAMNSDKEAVDPLTGEYNQPIKTYAEFSFIVRDCDLSDLYYRVFLAIRAIHDHEAREFLREADTMWAFFHPHRVDGMKRWAALTGIPIATSMRDDLSFGVA